MALLPLLHSSMALGTRAGPGGGSVRSFRSVSNMSRIPVWQGSQESLAAATSCSNLKEVSSKWDDGVTYQVPVVCTTCKGVELVSHTTNIVLIDPTNVFL